MGHTNSTGASAGVGLAGAFVVCAKMLLLPNPPIANNTISATARRFTLRVTAADATVLVLMDAVSCGRDKGSSENSLTRASA
jgi:hypothetical protein